MLSQVGSSVFLGKSPHSATVWPSPRGSRPVAHMFPGNNHVQKRHSPVFSRQKCSFLSGTFLSFWHSLFPFFCCSVFLIKKYFFFDFFLFSFFFEIFFFFLSGAQNLNFFLVSISLRFLLQHLFKKFNFSARLGRYPLRLVFLFFLLFFPPPFFFFSFVCFFPFFFLFFPSFVCESLSNVC